MKTGVNSFSSFLFSLFSCDDQKFGAFFFGFFPYYARGSCYGSLLVGYSAADSPRLISLSASSG